MKRLVTAMSVGAIASAPSVAHATSMDGLVVVVLGMFIGVPAALILVISIIVLLTLKKPNRFASAMQYLALPIGVAFPLSMVILGAKQAHVEAAFIFDLPVIALGIVATVIAVGKARRVP